MLKRKRINILSWLAPAMFLVFFSCTDNMMEYYEKPSYLVGNAWEELEERGNYSIFLSGIEKAGYESLVNGRGLVNIMAPDDEAFTSYLSAKGYASIDDMPDEELNKLIGFHLLYDAFNKNEYAQYNPYGSGNEVPNEMGLFYKHRTNARNPITKELDPLTNLEVSVVHKDLLLPVISKYMFESKDIDAKTNYEYFYPNSVWTDDPDGFNVSEATVKEYEVTTDNGFVYYIDRVLEPLETVHQSLKDKGDYSSFLSIYDRFSNFWLDDEATSKYGNGQDLYVHQHSGLPMIASEWPYNGEGLLRDFEDLPALSRDAFNVFVPDNNALNSFYEEYWSEYYDSLQAVNFLPIGYLLYNHVYQGSLVFPEEITREDISTSYGTPIIFDPGTDVTVSQICTNGSYYGLNKVLVPDMFNSIIGPLYRNPDYQIFLQMVASTGMFLTLSSDAVDYTAFFVNDSSIIETGYYDLPIRFNDPNPAIFGDETVQLLDGGWGNMSVGQMTNFINSHIASDLLTEVNGTKVYKSRNLFSYLYLRNNTVASNRLYNEDIGFLPVENIDGDWTNGLCYNSDTVLLREDKAFKYEISSADETPYLADYEEFSKLLTRAGLLTLEAPLDFILNNYMLFMPSNETILNAPDGTIPSEEAELAEYLKYYFVPIEDNELSDYVFPGANIQGTYFTFQNANVMGELPGQIQVIDNGTDLTLSNNTGSQTANVLSELPNIYGDCAVYLIDALIQPE